MADGVFNIAKGRVAELVRRVDANDPTKAALVVVALKETGLVSDETLIDYDTLEELLAGASDEATNAGYARIVLKDTEIEFITAPDDTNNRRDVDLPDFKWTGVAEAGGKWKKIIICYDPAEGEGTDAEIIPLTHHDFAITPDGSNITAEINAAGFYRAS